MAGLALTRIVALLLLLTATALCQRAVRNEATSALPDAPSVQPSADQASFRVFSGASCLGASCSSAIAAGDYGEQFALSRVYTEEPSTPKSSADFFKKYLSRSSIKPAWRYESSDGDSLVERATHAASSILYARDDAGEKTLNTSYFLRVLASALAHCASRPYWRRSLSQPFSDFGATIGNDAGMNVLHEFEPGIRQLMKSHQPRFVSRIEAHVRQK